jgi:hypothetical protein
MNFVALAWLAWLGAFEEAKQGPRLISLPCPFSRKPRGAARKRAFDGGKRLNTQFWN